MVRPHPFQVTYSLTTVAEEYFADIVKAYREEIEDLYQRGCRTCCHLSQREYKPINTLIP